MADGAHSKVKLNVRVPPTKKEQWKDALDEGETLTSLVQTAVDKELRDEYIPRQAIDELNIENQSDSNIDEIYNKLDDLQNTITALQKQLDDQSTPDTYDEREVSGVAMTAIQHLPEYDDFPPHNEFGDKLKRDLSWEEKKKFMRSKINDEAESKDGKPLDGSAEHIAELLDEELSLVRRGLIYLENNTTEHVRSIVADGTRHWIKV